MALKSRIELEELTDNNLPTNNSKQISAEKHREVVDAITESQFNIKDDELRLMNYETNLTLEEKLLGLFREVIKRGSFTGLDVGGHGIGNNFNTDGIIDSATVNGASSGDTIIRVVFTESIENKVIIPVMHFTGADGNASNDIGCPVIKIISTTSLDFAIGEYRGQTQSLKVEFIIL